MSTTCGGVLDLTTREVAVPGVAAPSRPAAVLAIIATTIGGTSGATAAGSGAPLPWSRTSCSPVSASTTVTSSLRSGQWSAPTRARIRAICACSGPVSAASAICPTRRRASAGFEAALPSTANASPIVARPPGVACRWSRRGARGRRPAGVLTGCQHCTDDARGWSMPTSAARSWPATPKVGRCVRSRAVSVSVSRWCTARCKPPVPTPSRGRIRRRRDRRPGRWTAESTGEVVNESHPRNRGCDSRSCRPAALRSACARNTGLTEIDRHVTECVTVRGCGNGRLSLPTDR